MEDIDTYDVDNPEVDTPVTRAVAKRLGMTVPEVRRVLDTFEEEFDRIDALQAERLAAKRKS